MKKLLHWVIVTGLIVPWLLLTPQVGAVAANLSRSYASQGSIEPGSIVSLTSLKSKTVILANTTNSDKIIGVAVGNSDAVISVDPDAAKVQITTSGIADVLVSDLDGDIKSGDKVAVSPFDGIGMKSTTGERIIGIAQTSFTRSSTALSTRQVKDIHGKTSTLRIGKVQINVVIGNDDNAGGQNQNAIQRVVKSLTGRTVPTIRIIISLIIAIVTMLTLTIMIYSAIYGSIISIGRNPMAKESIFKALRQVVWMSAMALLLAFGFIYLLLR